MYAGNGSVALHTIPNVSMPLSLYPRDVGLEEGRDQVRPENMSILETMRMTMIVRETTVVLVLNLQ